MGKKSVHDTVTELLPWFVNESLGEKEQDLVQVHLAECSQCRLERDRLQAIGQLVAEEDPVSPDYRFSYQKVMARIEAAERNRESTNIGEPATAGFARRWRALSGVAAVLIGAVMLVAGVQSFQQETTLFRTLSTEVGADAPIKGSAVRLALTFEQPIKAKTMRQALIETQSNIISGPDEEGTYVVEVIVPSNSNREQYLLDIRQIDGVRLAAYLEP